PVQPCVPLQAVPPPPAVAAGQPLPPPIVMYSPRPPALGGLTVVDFRALPLVAVAPPPPVAPVIANPACRGRLLSLCLEVGDNLFARGHHQDALRHFQIALSLTGDHAAINLRIGQCQPYVTLAAPIAVAPVIVATAVGRPRLLIFSFVVNCAPGLVPPACG